MWLIISVGFSMILAQKGHSCLFFERVSGSSVWVFRLLMVKAALWRALADGVGDRYLVTVWCWRYASRFVTWSSGRVLYSDVKSLILVNVSYRILSCVSSSEKLKGRKPASLTWNLASAYSTWVFDDVVL